jgi:peroxiredoxin
VIILLAVLVPGVLLGALAITGLNGGADTPSTGVTLGDESASGQLEVGNEAPAFEVDTLSGGTFQVPSGRPTILSFVNLCPTCIDATRAIGELQQSFEGLDVLAIASDPTADQARLEEFVRQAGSPAFELALDPDSTLTQRFEAFSMGANVTIVDGSGRITYRGPVDVESMRAALIEAGARE